MAQTEELEKGRGGLALALVQFLFTLGWTIYALMLPGLLTKAEISLGWLPLILMADQAIFAAMDIAFGVMADRLRDIYRRLARLLLVLTTVSALAFLCLPMAAGVSPGLLLGVLLLWVVSASVVRAPTLVLLAKRAKAAQRPALVFWYSAGMGLAMALSPFLGLYLKGADPQLPFALAALTLLGAVLVLLRVIGTETPLAEKEVPQPVAFARCLPLFLVLGVAGLAFQLHANVNAAVLYQGHAAKESLPWLLPLLWVGFFAMMLGAGILIKRFAAMPVATVGVFTVACSSYLAANAGSLNGLVALQVLAGAGWALAFSGLMEQTSAAGTRGAEGLFMGSFFAVTALSSLARIAFVSNWLVDWKEYQFVLPAVLLLLVGLLAAVDAQKWAKLKTPISP